MKTTPLLALAGVLCAGLFGLNAAETKPPGGPKGGRLLDGTKPLAEFVVEKDHTVTIHFYDEARKPVAATAQSVSVLADGKLGRIPLQLDKQGDSLVSKTRLPDGDGYNLAVQFRPSAGASPRNFRFKLDLRERAGCPFVEYACTCDH